ncbi:hypothetical protein [Lysobacter arvi]|uniref:EF-hand domain-containing protein n=1 Tax=Lysobacter arvi TaxID=3038776 RepID=A0ABU1CGA7_9GAMM|nr:hypothetical protein [Lysobacter arvi]MDR0183974.1 hypothetical protein [Lysobacter arvi]
MPIVISAQTSSPTATAPVVPPDPATQTAPVAPPADDPLPMDLDGDGVVTAAEHAAGARALFEHMDANRDGRVTREEMANFQRQVLGAAIPPAR